MFPKKGAIAIVTTVLALILLISFKTPADVPVSTGGTGFGDVGTGTNTNTGVNPATTADPGTSPAPGATAAPKGTSAPAGGSSAITGDVVSTRYGDVEVSITVANGKVSSVQAVELPSGGRSGRISDYAAPILSSEALQAQSAKIDIVSGATYTSDAYAQSLQSALDKAGIAVVTSQLAA